MAKQGLNKTHDLKTNLVSFVRGEKEPVEREREEQRREEEEEEEEEEKKKVGSSPKRYGNSPCI